MKKILSTLIVFIFIIISSSLIILSTIGLETKRFDSLISERINKTNKHININLNSVRFKLDIKNLDLFLNTTSPEILYKKIPIPIHEIKLYLDFISLIKTSVKIDKIILKSENLDTKKIKSLFFLIKPSNFKSFILNNVTKGNVVTEIELYLDKNNKIQNFISKGKVTNFHSKIFNNIFLSNANFDFFADKSDVLIKKLREI